MNERPKPLKKSASFFFPSSSQTRTTTAVWSSLEQKKISLLELLLSMISGVFFPQLMIITTSVLYHLTTQAINLPKSLTKSNHEPRTIFSPGQWIRFSCFGGLPRSLHLPRFNSTKTCRSPGTNNRSPKLFSSSKPNQATKKVSLPTKPSSSLFFSLRLEGIEFKVAGRADQVR